MHINLVVMVAKAWEHAKLVHTRLTNSRAVNLAKVVPVGKAPAILPDIIEEENSDEEESKKEQV